MKATLRFSPPTIFFAFLLFAVTSQLDALQIHDTAEKKKEKNRPRDQIELVRQLWEKEPDTTAIAEFDELGNLHRAWMQSSDGIFTQLVDFYLCEETQAELELVGEQSLKYQCIVKEWNGSVDKLLTQPSASQTGDAKKQLTESQTKKNQKDALDEYYAAKAEYLQELDDLLTPHQRKALSQIQFRFLVRTLGPTVFHWQEVRDFLGVERFPSDHPEFDEKGVIIRGENRPNEIKAFQKKIADARVEASNILLKQFSDDERKLIFSRWKYMVKDDVGLSELFRIHLSFEDQFKSIEPLKSPFQKVKHFPMFEMSPAGLFSTCELPDSRKPSLESATLNWFLGIWQKNRSGIEHLELTDAQIESINSIENERRNWYSVPMTAAGESVGSPASHNLTEDQRMALTQDFYGRLKHTLTGEQWAMLEQIAEKSLERKLGPVWDLRFGTLGRDLKLDDAAKEKLEQAAKVARQAFEEKTIEIEEFWLSERTKELSEPAQAKMRQLLGPPLRNTPANLSNYSFMP